MQEREGQLLNDSAVLTPPIPKPQSRVAVEGKGTLFQMIFVYINLVVATIEHPQLVAGLVMDNIARVSWII